jgi:hypothetical protein
LLAGALLSCGRTPPRAAPASGGAASGAARALGIEPRFRPPADGLLTDDQLDRFLRVRRAAKGRTDAENARALGLSADEIAWTRARVLEALAALDEKRVREASSEAYAKTLASLRSARAAAREPAEARTLDVQIAALERERAGMRREETAPPALAGNVRKVAARQAELEAVAP